VTRQLLKRIAALERSTAALPRVKAVTFSPDAMDPFAGPYEQWANKFHYDKKFWPRTPPWSGAKRGILKPGTLLLTYGERYRHPSNLTLELSCIYDVPYLYTYETTLSWYDHMLRNLPLDELVSETENIEQLSPAARGELDRRKKALAFLGCNDRFFLLAYLLDRKDIKHEWLFERCREVEQEPDGYIDLWSRFHYKSTIITFAGSIQEVLRDPEIKIAIFSVTQHIARAFLEQIKTEFESNDLLKTIYSDVLYENPRASGADGRPSKWGSARGITLKRTSNPKEATIEAHGLIDGQPTSRHFDLHIYDDVVTMDYLTEEAIAKTTNRWEHADNLGSHRGVRKQVVGTRYHFADTYSVILDRGSLKPRIYPATDNGKLDGNPVFLSRERWEKIKRDQRSTVAAQCLLDPIAGDEAIFNTSMLFGYDIIPVLMNVYILVDPSKGSSKKSDRTAIAVIGIDQSGFKYLLDGYRHRMQLSERYERVTELKKKWERHPGVQFVKIGWERYGKDAEIEALEQLQQRDRNFFRIEELNTPRQGGRAKNDRIERLEPDFRHGRFLLPLIVYNADRGGQCRWSVWNEQKDKEAEKGGKPRYPVGTIVYTPSAGILTARQRKCDETGQRHRIVQPIKRRDEEQRIYDVARVFMDEFLRHPFAAHDDLLDAVSMTPIRKSRACLRLSKAP
jgi:phage terminase large subunit-like protein